MPASNYKLITNTKQKGSVKRQVRKLLKFLCCLLFIATIPVLLYEMVIAKREDETADLFSNYRLKQIQNSNNHLTDAPIETKYLPIFLEKNLREDIFNFDDESTRTLSLSPTVSKTKEMTISVVHSEQNKSETKTHLIDITKIASNGAIDQLNEIYKPMKNANIRHWCGFGSQILPNNVAQIEDTGKCCREHNECSQTIDVGETKYGIQNNGTFTLSHCSCEEKFYECLKKVDAAVPNVVGFTYFTVFGSKCFKEEHSVIQCTHKSITVYAFKKENNVRCVEYSFDADSPKNYALFDLPVYTF